RTPRRWCAHPWAFFNLRKYWDDWEQTARLGLAAAREGSDLAGEAAILHHLSVLAPTCTGSTTWRPTAWPPLRSGAASATGREPARRSAISAWPIASSAASRTPTRS